MNTPNYFRDNMENDKFISARLDLLNKRLIMSFPANIFCATIAFIALYGDVNQFLLLGWYAAFIMITFMRIYAMFWLRQHRENPSSHLKIFIFFAYLTASAWGVLDSILMPQNDNILDQMLVIIVIAGVTAGAMQSLQASFSASFGYAVITMVPLIIWSGLEGIHQYSQSIDYSLICLGIVTYFILIAIIALHGYRLIIEILTLRFNVAEQSIFKEAILNSTSESIVTVNTNNLIVTCNKQAEHELGYLESDLKNKNITIILPDFDSRWREFSMLEKLAKDKQNNFIPVELTTKKISIQDENILVIFMQNITERKRLQKMKDEFVSSVSHELRTPLTSIQGSIGLTLGGALGPLTEKMKKMLEIAFENCKRLILIVNDILDIQKIEAGKIDIQIKTLELTKLINETITANKVYADKQGVTLIFKPVNDIKIEADPGRFIQALTNLLSNAIKFSPRDEEVIISIEEIDGMGRVSVSNKGPGIPYDFQSKIFQKFSQADPRNLQGHAGTGLGLSISKSIIEKMHGKINFISIPNELTTFYFDLPKAMEHRDNHTLSS